MNNRFIYKAILIFSLIFLYCCYINAFPQSEKNNYDSRGIKAADTPLLYRSSRNFDLTEREDERLNMVSSQIENRGIKSPEVLKAMKVVPRHLFVPEELSNSAYSDNPLPIGFGQTISQPYIVAYMTELLNLKKGDKVLEIGTGSGYQAAVLAEITDTVYSIEIIKALAERTAELYKKLGYSEIKAKTGDGYFGWEEEAPFDAIIVTAAAGHVPPPLIKQLKTGGRIVIPVGGVYQIQTLILIEKISDEKLKTYNLLPVRFVPMTGAVQEEKK